MTRFNRVDFKEFETYIKCKKCNEGLECCASCERPITTDETIYCYTKKGEQTGKYHICVECYEGEND